MPSTCSIRPASSSAGTPARRSSRAIGRARSSASISRVLHARGPGRRPAGEGPSGGGGERAFRGRRLAGPQGRQPLLGERRRRADPRRPGTPDRLRQGHPRHHRADGGPGGAARERAPLPAAGRRRRRLRHLHARPERHHHQLERRRRADQGLYGRRDHRPAFLALLHARRTAPPACRPASSRPPGARAATRPKAGACARTAAASGPRCRSTPSATRAASSSASPRSPATSPSAAPPQEALRESERQFRLLVARRHRLRALHARSQRHRDQLERRRRAHQGLHGRRDRRPAFLALLHRARPLGRPAGPRPPHRRAQKDASRPRAGGCARTAACSGRTSSSIRSATTTAASSASPRSPATSPSAARPSSPSRRRRRSCAQTQKMEALGQLTGGVAHDFNNLLMVVSGHVHTLKKLVADDPKGVRAAEAIELAARRGESLTRQLLSFSRRQLLTPVVAGVGERLEAVRPLIASSIGAQVRLADRRAAGALAGAGRSRRVRARAHQPRAQCPRRHAGGRHDHASRPRTSTLQPADTRLGLKAISSRSRWPIPAAASRPISCRGCSTPSSRRRRPDKGTGLGLSQVHGFVHQSGGTLGIESELGKGTRVTLYLPRGARPGPRSARPRPAADADTGGTVLLVEDNPDVAEASAVLLEQLGYEVHRAGDAEAALREVEARELDLVVSDIVMAGAMDGLGLARAIRERHPTLPVLLATGYSNAVAVGRDRVHRAAQALRARRARPRGGKARRRGTAADEISCTCATRSGLARGSRSGPNREQYTWLSRPSIGNLPENKLTLFAANPNDCAGSHPDRRRCYDRFQRWTGPLTANVPSRGV